MGSGREFAISSAKFAIFLLLFSIGLPLYAGAEEVEQQAVVVILVPLSGELGPLGHQLVEAARFAGEDVGVAIEALDEGETVDDMLAALNTLEDRDDVAAVIGPIRRRNGHPAAHRARQLGLPLVVFSGQGGVERAGNVVFRARPDRHEQSARVASYLVEEMGLTEIGVMAPRSEHGNELLTALVEAIDDAGGRVIALAQYAEDTTDFRPVLQILVGRRLFVGPNRSPAGRRPDRFGTVDLLRRPSISFDALIIADYHDVVARILPFLPGAGIQTGGGGDGRAVQLIGLAGWRGDGLARAGAHGVGAIFFDTYGGETEGGQAEDFAHRFEGRLGRSATTPEAEIYDLVSMISGGIRARQPGESFRQAALIRLQQPRAYPGVTGSWSFDEDGAPLRYLRPYRVIEEGRWVPLAHAVAEEDGP